MYGFAVIIEYASRDRSRRRHAENNILHLLSRAECDGLTGQPGRTLLAVFGAQVAIACGAQTIPPRLDIRKRELAAAICCSCSFGLTINLAKRDTSSRDRLTRSKLDHQSLERGRRLSLARFQDLRKLG